MLYMVYRHISRIWSLLLPPLLTPWSKPPPFLTWTTAARYPEWFCYNTQQIRSFSVHSSTRAPSSHQSHMLYNGLQIPTHSDLPLFTLGLTTSTLRLHSPLASHTSLLSIPHRHLPCSHLRTFALAISLLGLFSTRYLQGSLLCLPPNSLLKSYLHSEASLTILFKIETKPQPQYS